MEYPLTFSVTTIIIFLQPEGRFCPSIDLVYTAHSMPVHRLFAGATFSCALQYFFVPFSCVLTFSSVLKYMYVYIFFQSLVVYLHLLVVVY